jgi:ABC-type antimicrobial peptide transport system ATPase subunit
LESNAAHNTGGLSKTAAAFLNRRAWHRSVRTEYAAVDILRFQSGAAALAVVEELASAGISSADSLPQFGQRMTVSSIMSTTLSDLAAPERIPSGCRAGPVERKQIHLELTVPADAG